MIKQYLSKKNENATVPKTKKFSELNKTIDVEDTEVATASSSSPHNLVNNEGKPAYS
jgi:hypothetical protein